MQTKSFVMTGEFQHRNKTPGVKAGCFAFSGDACCLDKERQVSVSSQRGLRPSCLSYLDLSDVPTGASRCFPVGMESIRTFHGHTSTVLNKCDSRFQSRSTQQASRIESRRVSAQWQRLGFGVEMVHYVGAAFVMVRLHHP